VMQVLTAPVNESPLPTWATPASRSKRPSHPRLNRRPGPRQSRPRGVGAWVVSPDGSTVAARGPDPAIRLYDLHGAAPRQVPGLTGEEVPVGWISDGLLVMRPGDPSSALGEIYRIDTRTGRQDVWKNILPRDRAGIMNLISFRVTPEGQSVAYTWHRALSSLYVADGLA
jgi:hypothetical protein